MEEALAGLVATAAGSVVGLAVGVKVAGLVEEAMVAATGVAMVAREAVVVVMVVEVMVVAAAAAMAAAVAAVVMAVEMEAGAMVAVVMEVAAKAEGQSTHADARCQKQSRPTCQGRHHQALAADTQAPVSCRRVQSTARMNLTHTSPCPASQLRWLALSDVTLQSSRPRKCCSLPTRCTLRMGPVRCIHPSQIQTGG